MSITSANATIEQSLMMFCRMLHILWKETFFTKEFMEHNIWQRYKTQYFRNVIPPSKNLHNCTEFYKVLQKYVERCLCSYCSCINVVSSEGAAKVFNEVLSDKSSCHGNSRQKLVGQRLREVHSYTRSFEKISTATACLGTKIVLLHAFSFEKPPNDGVRIFTSYIGRHCRTYCATNET